MNSTAIIARTNRALLPFETALSEANIQFHYINKSGFFSQPEIQAVLSYLGAVLFPANYLISGMLRSEFHPTKYLPRNKLAERFKELKGQDDQISYWELLTKEPHSLVESKNLESLRNFAQFVHSLTRYRNLAAQEALKQVLGSLKVGDHFSELEAVDNDPLGNLAELVRLSGKWTDIKGFLDYTRRASAASKGRKGVALSTIHGFKGLESSKVFVVGASEGNIPHSKATDLQEERNIWFTACSRAERELVITYSGVPSQFLKENK